ncbi:MAG: glycosyltransferase family 4 protein [Burkholderiales bacterium]|nr:glycosyltransferase family 4 protein [Burkholderiales bacterium]
MNPRPIHVLYIHHAGAFGGASRSLLELMEGFPPGSVTARLLAQRGSAAAAFAERGIATLETRGISQFDHTRYGHYRGRRWLLLARELAYLPATIAGMLRARRRWPAIDIVHVNEIVAVPAIILAKRLFRAPLVVHVRSVQHPRHDALRSRLLARSLRRHADAVIAIDETVRASLPPGIPAEVIHNAYTPRADAAARSAPLPPRTPGTMRVAMVGNLLPLKGVSGFLEAARRVAERGAPVEFVIVGGNTRRLAGVTGALLEAGGFARDMEAEVDRYIARHGLAARVRRVAFTRDIDAIYRDIDVLCFPSLLDAPGRPVFEAAHWGAPSIVATAAPAADTLIHGETGLAVAPGDPGALAAAIEQLARAPAEVKRMGEAARRLALENFDARGNAARMLAVYRRLLARPERA